MSVRRCKRETGAAEFLRWRLYLTAEAEEASRREWEQPRREDYFHAQTAFFIRLLVWVVSNLFAKEVGKPDFTPKDFLLPFQLKGRAATGHAPARRGTKRPKREKPLYTKEESARMKFQLANDSAKMRWAGFFGRGPGVQP